MTTVDSGTVDAPAVASQPSGGRRKRKPNLSHPTYYINRELSWLAFNERVLEEAEDEKNPLLERAKFLSIFGTNLDEFFMVRVSGLRRQMETGVVASPPDGMAPGEQMAAVRERLEPLLERSNTCWRDELEPRLRAEGVAVLRYEELSDRERRDLRFYFQSEIFPILTPLAFDPWHPFPHISNLSINLAVTVRGEGETERFARLKVPASLPRLLPLSEAIQGTKGSLRPGSRTRLVWMEDVVAANLDLLFPGLEVLHSFPFRVTRDADFDIEEDEAADLLTAMTEVVEQRHFGSAIRLEVAASAPERIREVLAHNLELQSYQVFTTDRPVGLAGLLELSEVDRPDLKDPPFQPAVHPAFSGDESIFSVIRRRDVVLFHPYDSFQPVVRFLEEAANDPDVVAIKQTLYRVGANSPIVRALMQARQNGKQVSALVELKARFDEERNIVWARALEQAGVHVVYGVFGLKTHAKMCLVVRREEDGVRRYVHLGTGNYNPSTAKVYTDLGFFTNDARFGEDVSDLFNALTGYSAKLEYRKLIVAPHGMRDALLARIERRVSGIQDERAGRQALHQGALQGVSRRSQDRSPSPRHLLPATWSTEREREHPGDLRRRSLPRACPHVLLSKRRRRGAADGERRPDAAQSRRASRDAVPRRASRASGRAARRRAGLSDLRQQEGSAVEARRPLRTGPCRRRRADRQ
jgi:polyphosphate kinase